MTELPHALSEVLADPLIAACRSRAAGRPVVGIMSNSVPLELIDAAGCLPLQLPTAPRTQMPRADRYMESRFDPIVRCAFEHALSGEYACVDLLVLPRTSDSCHRFYYYLCEVARAFGESVPDAFLYDLLHTPWPTSGDYNVGSTTGLLQRLAALTGRSVGEPELAASIARYNRIRAKLAELAQRRHERPSRLPGGLMLDVWRASQRLAPEVLEPALDSLLAEASPLAPGTPVLLAGSAHDTSRIHAAIARAGGQVVADYHVLGDLLYGTAIAPHAAPLSAITEHYHRATISPRTFPAPLASLIELARRSGAARAIFYFYEEEEALTWDYPAQRRALAELGLPVLALDRQAYASDASSLEPQLRRFFAEPAAAHGTHD